MPARGSHILWTSPRRDAYPYPDRPLLEILRLSLSSLSFFFRGRELGTGSFVSAARLLNI